MLRAILDESVTHYSLIIGASGGNGRRRKGHSILTVADPSSMSREASRRREAIFNRLKSFPIMKTGGEPANRPV
jgi:hypothetical protein